MEPLAVLEGVQKSETMRPEQRTMQPPDSKAATACSLSNRLGLNNKSSHEASSRCIYSKGSKTTHASSIPPPLDVQQHGLETTQAVCQQNMCLQCCIHLLVSPPPMLRLQLLCGSEQAARLVHCHGQRRCRLHCCCWRVASAQPGPAAAAAMLWWLHLCASCCWWHAAPLAGVPAALQSRPAMAAARYYDDQTATLIDARPLLNGIACANFCCVRQAW